MKKLLVLTMVLLTIVSYGQRRSSSRHRSYGFSFSWKRAVGISSAKQKFARITGIPTTRQGRQAKIGRKLGIK